MSADEQHGSPASGDEAESIVPATSSWDLLRAPQAAPPAAPRRAPPRAWRAAAAGGLCAGAAALLWRRGARGAASGGEASGAAPAAVPPLGPGAQAPPGAGSELVAVAAAAAVAAALAAACSLRRCVGSPTGSEAEAAGPAAAIRACIAGVGELVPCQLQGSPQQGQRRGRGWCAGYAESLRARRDLVQLACLWAVAAETLGHCWLSIAGVRAAQWDICHVRLGFSDGDKYVRSPDALAGAYGVIFCNLIGTFVMGAACAQDRGGGAGQEAPAGPHAAAVKLGFCPCITTFPGAVQVSVSLLEHNSTVFAAASLFGGPALFGVGARALPHTCWPCGRFSDKAAKAVLAFFIVGSFAFELGRAPLALLVGWAMAMAAVLVSDVMFTLVPAKLLWGVHWETVTANLVALSLVAGHQTASSYLRLLQPDSSSVFAIVSGKFQTTFCGTVSSYSSFAGDVMGPVLLHGAARGWRRAALNWVVNVAAGVFFIGVFLERSLREGEVVGLMLQSLDAVPELAETPTGFRC